MLAREENDLIIRTNPGTPLGAIMRRFWIPAFIASETRKNDGASIHFKFLGEGWRMLGTEEDPLVAQLEADGVHG